MTLLVMKKNTISLQNHLFNKQKTARFFKHFPEKNVTAAKYQINLI